MKKLIVAVVIIALLWITSCSTATEFKGASENWSISCTVNVAKKEKSYQIRYIGPDERADSVVSYSFMDSVNFQEHDERTESLKNLKISGSSTNSQEYAEEERFALLVKWDDYEETIPIVKAD